MNQRSECALTPAVLERVRVYMGIPPWDERLMPLRHFAADVLDKLVSTGEHPIISNAKGHSVCVRVDSVRDPDGEWRVAIIAPTWSEAVLLAAAAVQEGRE